MRKSAKHYRRRFTLRTLQLLGARVIAVTFQSAMLLAPLAHLYHLLLVGSWSFAYFPPSSNLKCFGYIPVAFQSATLLAPLAHLYHLLLVGSWGFAYLPPSSNLKSFGYK
ncbi:MAG: hypothetical protein QS721_02595 [Candidatus Endonucleobacter sp. (ex Gigantidas childressi)]|nr:hypothetical protein [Candidatus Endonucleobacter sp. (ex Gigantidas childressi)]